MRRLAAARNPFRLSLPRGFLLLSLTDLRAPHALKLLHRDLLLHLLQIMLRSFALYLSRREVGLARSQLVLQPRNLS